MAPELCTAVLGFLTTLTGCMEPEQCRMSDDGTRKLCIPARGISCPQPIVEWRCRRSDGLIYIWQEPHSR